MVIQVYHKHIKIQVLCVSEVHVTLYICENLLFQIHIFWYLYTYFASQASALFKIYQYSQYIAYRDHSISNKITHIINMNHMYPKYQ